jgi:hypothetical protein
MIFGVVAENDDPIMGLAKFVGPRRVGKHCRVVSAYPLGMQDRQPGRSLRIKTPGSNLRQAVLFNQVPVVTVDIQQFSNRRLFTRPGEFL